MPALLTEQSPLLMQSQAEMRVREALAPLRQPVEVKGIPSALCEVGHGEEAGVVGGMWEAVGVGGCPGWGGAAAVCCKQQKDCVAHRR